MSTPGLRWASEAKKERYRPRWSRACAAGITLVLLSAAGCPPQQPTEVWGWGDNDDGQLGFGGFSPSSPLEPFPVGLENVRNIGAGCSHSVALKNDGTVWQWGSPFRHHWANCRLPHPYYVPTGEHLEPTLIHDAAGAPLTDVRAISVGANHTLAIHGSDNIVVGWGQNFMDQLGLGWYFPYKIESAEPAEGPGGDVPGSGIPEMIAVAAGEEHSLALQSGPPNLTVWAWGNNRDHQLGVISTNHPGCGGAWNTLPADCQNTQKQLPGLTEVIAIAAGVKHSLVLKTDGTVWAWGSNDFGQIGAPSLTASSTATPQQTMIQSPNPPFTVTALTGVTDIAAGDEHSLALRSDGTVWTWGSSHLGQLGIGERPHTGRGAFQVHGPGNAGVLTDIVAIAAGSGHSLAVAKDGRVWSWGDNRRGQLGAASADLCYLIDRPTPAPCSLTPILVGRLPARALKVAAGTNHSLALLGRQN